ncbi:MAG: response regulator [Aphanothece sp. CMT-3BRIN-NPC111]|jgi:YesN/AraC family two-component response regulator|nr:response regulator [Aphanothece sp. CMT-3BRIN-NPC111]
MPIKILIVDDELPMERLITQRFRKKIQAKEYQFIFAHNGKEAWNKVQTNPDIDIVLTDLKMPEMDGFTLLSKLSNTELITRTVIISAYGDFNNMRRAMNEGAFDFIRKPIDFKDLEITISRTISKNPRYENQHNLASRASKSVQPNSTTLEPAQKKPRLSSVVSLAKKLTPDEQFEAVMTITETFSLKDLDELREELEAQRYLAIENEHEQDLFISTNVKNEWEIPQEDPEDPDIFLKRLKEEDPDSFLKKLQQEETNISLQRMEKGYIEARYIKKKLASGELKKYGPYYFKRWREGGKVRSLYLGTEDPRKKQANQQFANKPGEMTVTVPAVTVATPKTTIDEPQIEETQTVAKSKPPLKLYGKEFERRNLIQDS